MAGESSVAELILKIVADSTEVRKALQETSDAQKQFTQDTSEESKKQESIVDSSIARIGKQSEKTTKSFTSMGNGLRLLSRNLMFMGTMMMAPIVGSLAAASKVSGQVSLAMSRLGDVSQDFALTIGKAALPSVEKFTEVIEKVLKWFKELPDPVKKGIVDFGLWGGAILVASGTAVRFIAILSRMKNMLSLVGVALASVALAKWLEDNADKIKEFGQRVKSGIQSWFKQDKGPIMKFDVGDNLKTATTKAKELAIVLEKIKITSSAAGDAFKDFSSGVIMGLTQLSKSLGNWSNTFQEMTVQAFMSLKSTLSDVFFDSMTGEFKSLEEYAANFGKALLRMFTDLIAQLLVYSAVVMVMKAAGIPIPGWLMGSTSHEGGFFAHVGGFIRKAHEGLAPGEVNVIAQSGEGILSRNGMATLGSVDKLNKLNAGQDVSGGLQVNLTQVIQAWGPEDVYRERKMLAAAMIEELERNGPFRGAIRKYR